MVVKLSWTLRAVLVWVLLAAVVTPVGAAEEPDRLSIAGVDVVSFPNLQSTVVVLNKSGVPVMGLTKDNFSLVEDGKSIAVGSVDEVTTNQVSVTVVLGLDVSGSMKGKPLTDASAAITAFIDRLSDVDRVAAETFGGAGCAVSRGPDLSTDKAPTKSFIAGASAVGNTPLYDAMLTAIQTAAAAPEGRRMVVILTDGEDTCSKVSQDTVVAAAVRNGIPLYLIGLGPSLKADVLQNLANLTGGQFIPVDDSSKLASIYEGLTNRLKTQYVVRFTSGQVADRKEHVIQIRVKSGANEAVGEARYTPPTIQPQLKLSVASGQKIDRPTSIEVTTSSPVQLAKADFYFDGAQVASVTKPPFATTIGPSGLFSGARSIRVHVTDTGGGETDVTTSVEIVQPQLRISVAPGQTIDGPTAIELSTNPQVELAKADFYLDTTHVATVDKAPYKYSLDPTGLADGSHTIRVSATDASGKAAEISTQVMFARTGIFGAIPFYVPLGLVLALPAVALVLVSRRRRRELRCPKCGKKLESGWSACPYCSQPESPVAVAAPPNFGPVVQPTEPAPTITPEGGPGRSDTTAIDARPPQVERQSGLQAGRKATQLLSVQKQSPAWFVIKSGAHRGTLFQLGPGETTIGRDETCDIALDDEACSRQHARVRLVDGAFYLTDLDTTNGTLINGRRVTRQKLTSGDEVTIGDTMLAFTSVEAAGQGG